VRIQQRTGRKTITTVQGIAQEYDLPKIVRYLKKVRRLSELVRGFASSRGFAHFSSWTRAHSCPALCVVSSLA